MISSLIIFMFVLAAAAIVLEIRVVNKGGKYTGFVLPGLTLLLSVFFLYLFMNGSEAGAGGYIVTFLLLNIPTIVLFLICLTVSKDREAEKKREEDKELESIRITDL